MISDYKRSPLHKPFVGMKDLVPTRGIDYLLTQSSQIFRPSYGPAESDASMDKLTWWLELADWYALKHQPGPNSLRAIWHRPVEPVCYKKQQKKFLTNYWFGE